MEQHTVCRSSDLESGHVNKAATTLWFLLALRPDEPVVPDPGEFSDSGWFPRAEIARWPIERTDPQMPRLLAKLGTLQAAQTTARTRHAAR